ncbi:MAG: gamma-glutamyl-gamma-aminobutyrate hydrolase family protein [Betaproteobacteria bacterium]|nr:gamma-glutamyl-gamma-aminobutyrate hydrolase family protein [Betaproteobacteria bacterium]
MLGICRGIQLINVAFGGTLVQDLPTERSSPVNHDPNAPAGERCHGIEITPGTRLAGALGATRALMVNSYHHQAVEQLAPGFAVTARASDGVIEAMEFTERNWWCLAVQWHPEDLTADPVSADRGIFRAFAEAVQTNAADRRGSR